MSQARTFFGITLALFSAYLGATLPAELMKAEPSCLAFIKLYDHETNQTMSRRIYEIAFKLSLDGKNSEAQQASSCAAWLDHGSKNWAYDFNTLIK